MQPLSNPLSDRSLYGWNMHSLHTGASGIANSSRAAKLASHLNHCIYMHATYLHPALQKYTCGSPVLLGRVTCPPLRSGLTWYGSPLK
jgi:hypothetical protein